MSRTRIPASCAGRTMLILRRACIRAVRFSSRKLSPRSERNQRVRRFEKPPETRNLARLRRLFLRFWIVCIFGPPRWTRSTVELVDPNRICPRSPAGGVNDDDAKPGNGAGIDPSLPRRLLDFQRRAGELSPDARDRARGAGDERDGV